MAIVFWFCFFVQLQYAYYKNRAYSLTSPLSMQSYRSKRKFLHKEGVQLPQDLFGRPIWSIWSTWSYGQYGQYDQYQVIYQCHDIPMSCNMVCFFVLEHHDIMWICSTLHKNSSLLNNVSSRSWKIRLKLGNL